MPPRPAKRARRGAPLFAAAAAAAADDDDDENALQEAKPDHTPRHANFDGSLALRAAVAAGTPTPLHPKRPRDEQRSTKRLGLALHDDDDDDDDDDEEDDDEVWGGEDDNNDVELDFSQVNKDIRDSISRPLGQGAQRGGAPREAGAAIRTRASAKEARAPKTVDAPALRKRGRPKGSAKRGVVVQRSGTPTKPVPRATRSVALRLAEEATVPVESPRTRRGQSLRRPKPVLKGTTARPVGDAYDLRSDDVAAQPPPEEASQQASPIRQNDELPEEEIAESIEQHEAEAASPSGAEPSLLPPVRPLATDKDRPVSLRAEAVAYLCELGGEKEEDLAVRIMELERKDLSRRLWTSAKYVARRFKETPLGDDVPLQTRRLQDKSGELEKGFNRIEELLNKILERLRADKETRSRWIKDLHGYQIPTLVLLLRWTFGLGVRRFFKRARGTFSYVTLGFLSQVMAWLAPLEDALPNKYAEERKVYRQHLQTFSESVRSAIDGLDYARQQRQEEERIRAAQIRNEPAARAAQEKEEREERERASRQYLAMCASTHELRSLPAPLEVVWMRTLAARARSDEERGMLPWAGPHEERDSTEQAPWHERVGGGHKRPLPVLREDHGGSILDGKAWPKESPGEDADDWAADDSTPPHPWSNEESDILLRALKGAAGRPNLEGVARLLDRERWDVEQQAELFRETARVMAREKARRPPRWARTSG